MKITLGNLGYIAKKLHASSYDTALLSSKPQDPPVTPGEAAVLRYLIQQTEPKSIRDIEYATGLVQSWVSTTVKTLATRGWVEIGKDAKDRRVTTVIARQEIIEEAKVTCEIDANTALFNLLPKATDAEMQKIKDGIETIFDVLSRQEGGQKRL
ncbi:hypothetical protein AltI4_45200 (plasmid) [Alteromonas sp. I4]|nr:hypothetical protein AltI4_45200 [Alteromonas sp. I4]